MGVERVPKTGRGVVRVTAGSKRSGTSQVVRTSLSSGSRTGSWPSSQEADLRQQLLVSCANEDMSGVLVAIIVPVLKRPANVRPLYDSFISATSTDDARMYFVAQRSDTEERAAIEAIGLEPILVDDVDRSWAKKINRGYERSTEPWILLGADDLRFHDGWVGRVRGMLTTHVGVIGTNDLGNPNTINGSHSTHPLVRRTYANICGTVDERGKIVHEGYDHNYPDTELVATARRRGLYVHRVDCVIEHLHPAWGKGQNDPVYIRGNLHVQEDSLLFTNRARKFGW